MLILAFRPTIALVLVLTMASGSASSTDLVMPAGYAQDGSNAAPRVACSPRPFFSICHSTHQALETLREEC